MSVSGSYPPTPDAPLRLTERVSPAWGGDATSGAEALWGQETMGDMGGMTNPLLAGDGGASSTPRSATACRSVGGSSARRGSGSGHQSTAGTTGSASACRSSRRASGGCSSASRPSCASAGSSGSLEATPTAAPPISGYPAKPASSCGSLKAAAQCSSADQGRPVPRGRPSVEKTDLWNPGSGSKPAKQTVRDHVNARPPSAEPSSPYDGRPRTAGRSRQRRHPGREAQQPAVPSPDKSGSRPRCEAQQPEAARPRFASIAIASPAENEPQSEAEPTGHPAGDERTENATETPPPADAHELPSVALTTQVPEPLPAIRLRTARGPDRGRRTQYRDCGVATEQRLDDVERPRNAGSSRAPAAQAGAVMPEDAIPRAALLR